MHFFKVDIKPFLLRTEIIAHQSHSKHKLVSANLIQRRVLILRCCHCWRYVCTIYGFEDGVGEHRQENYDHYDWAKASC